MLSCLMVFLSCEMFPYVGSLVSRKEERFNHNADCGIHKQRILHCYSTSSCIINALTADVFPGTGHSMQLFFFRVYQTDQGHVNYNVVITSAFELPHMSTFDGSTRFVGVACQIHR